MSIRLLVIGCVVVAALQLGIIGSFAAGPKEEGTARISADQVVIGDAGTLAVTGSDFRACAGKAMSLSLIFPLPPRPGYNRIDEAPRMGLQAVKVDGSGSFEGALSVPKDFPGAWIGYVAMEGQCVTTGRQRLLGTVRVAVPLGSSVAQSLGISETSGSVVVIPADAVTTYPIMPDDPQKDPYAHFQPVVLVDSAGKICSQDGTSRKSPSGDILLAVAAGGCAPGTAAVVVGPQKVTLVDRATVRPGYAVGLPVTWPPPGTGDAGSEPVRPSAPSSGKGAGVHSAGSSDETIWVAGGALALVFLFGIVAATRRPSR
jgi:hypothetical protein